MGLGFRLVYVYLATYVNPFQELPKALRVTGLPSADLQSLLSCVICQVSGL